MSAPTTTLPSTSLRPLFTLPVIVAALGYFVDVYDLLLFNIVRVPSLNDMGLSEAEVSLVGGRILNFQQAGLLLGGILWGILGDKRGDFRYCSGVSSRIRWRIWPVASCTTRRFTPGFGW